MRIAVPSEVKNNEKRVALTPIGVHALVGQGHDVSVQKGAGLGSGITDEAYEAAGARLVEGPDATWEAGELVLKVKEPIESEYQYLREDLTLFTYLHLAADRPLTDALLKSKTTSIAYETVQLPNRSLPLLAPMSEIAGRLSAIVGPYYMMSAHGGLGRLPGGIPGVETAKVVVIGGGIAGEHAAANALGLGAQVTVVDISIPRLRQLQSIYGERLQTRVSTPSTIASLLKDADLVIGSALIPGAKAPKLVTDAMVAEMKTGSVLVDIAIDQGGCFEGSHPTTHAEPTFPVHNSIYYCVANMPGAVAETSTYALTNATLPYASAIAKKGWEQACRDDQSLALGISTHDGKMYTPGVAEAFGLDLATF
jgi:alanine dehydrogenase